jgi:hypothetical protein
MDINNYWQVVLNQEASKIEAFFHEEAVIKWRDTNEQFTVSEFIQANCEYPGEWSGEIKRIERTPEQLISVTHVFSKDKSANFHVVSFIKIKDNKIMEIDEYWGEIGSIPQWRIDKNIGRKID